VFPGKTKDLVDQFLLEKTEGRGSHLKRVKGKCSKSTYLKSKFSEVSEENQQI